MEVKINREIRQYTESVFFGLSLRQFVCALLALVAAVELYFLLRPAGTEMVSWACVLGAAPFAAMEFISYHSMPAERFLRVWLWSELIEPKRLCFEPANLYYEALRETLAAREREGYINT